MTRPGDWLRRHPFAVAFAAMALIVTVGFWRMQQISDRASENNAARIADESSIVETLRAQVQCTKRTLDASATRTKQLTPLANGRLNDLFAALDEALAGHQKAARRIYERASRENRAYLRYVQHHPVPTLVRVCERLHTPSPPNTPRRTAPPAPRPTVTVHVPGPTRTVTVPGPVRTVIRTRTVTVAPGHHHGHHRHR